MTDDPGKNKVIVKRESKQAHWILDSSKTSQSLRFVGTVGGFLPTPYIVYKAKNLYSTRIQNGHIGARYNRSKFSWLNEAIFKEVGSLIQGFFLIDLKGIIFLITVTDVFIPLDQFFGHIRGLQSYVIIFSI